jgi:hypothetical protein
MCNSFLGEGEVGVKSGVQVPLPMVVGENHPSDFAHLAPIP